MTTEPSGDPAERPGYSIRALLLGCMRRVQVPRGFLRTLRRHLHRERLSWHAPRSEQRLLDVVLGQAREAVIELARLSEYQHSFDPWLFHEPVRLGGGGTSLLRALGWTQAPAWRMAQN